MVSATPLSQHVLNKALDDALPDEIEEDLPEIEIPESDFVAKVPIPLLDSDWGFIKATKALIRSKEYERKDGKPRVAPLVSLAARYPRVSQAKISGQCPVQSFDRAPRHAAILAWLDQAEP